MQTAPLYRVKDLVLSPSSHPHSHVQITPGTLGSSKRGPEQGVREGLEPESSWKALTPGGVRNAVL